MGQATNTVDQSRSVPLQVPGSTSAGGVICGTDLTECVSVPGDFLQPQGAFPLAFTPLGVGLIAQRLRRPLIRGMPTGPLAFLGMPGACGPCARTHLKKAFCHTCLLGGASNKHRGSISVLFEQYETSYLFYVILFFLCNIICYLISVFALSLVTLSGATTITHKGWYAIKTKKPNQTQPKIIIQDLTCNEANQSNLRKLSFSVHINFL